MAKKIIDRNGVVPDIEFLTVTPGRGGGDISISTRQAFATHTELAEMRSKIATLYGREIDYEDEFGDRWEKLIATVQFTKVFSIANGTWCLEGKKYVLAAEWGLFKTSN